MSNCEIEVALDTLQRRGFFDVVMTRGRDGGGLYYIVVATSCIAGGGDSIRRRDKTLMGALRQVVEVAERIESEEELAQRAQEFRELMGLDRGPNCPV